MVSALMMLTTLRMVLSGNDKQRSQGIYTYVNGDKYEGWFENDKEHGQGNLIYTNGAKYEGWWKKGQKHGHGIYTYVDGDKYEGSWESDKRHGQGNFTYAIGDKYEGSWESDKRHGQGIYTYVNGNKYEGSWEKDQQHGQGNMTYASGDKYEGSWESDKRHGQGIYTSVNGAKYEGWWENDKRHGQGIIVFANLDIYKGVWKDDTMSEGNFDLHGEIKTITNGKVLVDVSLNEELSCTPVNDFHDDKYLTYNEQIGGTCWLYATTDAYIIHGSQTLIPTRVQPAIRVYKYALDPNVDKFVNKLMETLNATCEHGGNIEHALLYLFEGYQLIQKNDFTRIQCFLQNVGPLVVPGDFQGDGHAVLLVGWEWIEGELIWVFKNTHRSRWVIYSSDED